jgi:hypothetical protein
MATGTLLAIVLLLVNGGLLYVLARRHASRNWSALCAAAFALNPASIITALTWGPAPLAGCALALVAVYGFVRSRQTGRDVSLWSILGIAAAAGVVFLLGHQFATALPMNSIDADSLWTIKNAPQTSDSQTILFVPQFVWGLGLFAAATALLIARNVGVRDTRTPLESAALLALAFCLLTTRAFEHTLIFALALVAAAMPLARRYITAYLVLSFSVLVAAVHSHDAAATWSGIQHALSFLNVAVFFGLGYWFLGQDATAADAAIVADDRSGRRATPPIRRSWFDPGEGQAHMVRLDYFVALGITVGSFLIMYYRYWFPREKIFDEIYFARAAEEYLNHQYIYENTHPPVTKLIITFSTWLFGGLNGGDNSTGWRFLGVVAAALSVWMLYALAKRITRSTLFSAYAAGLFAFDGMHFVQARIATPETYVVLFATATIYTFYRFWVASQVRIERSDPDRKSLLRIVGFGASVLVAAGITALIAWRLPNQVKASPSWLTPATESILILYLAAGFYLLYRLVIEALLLRDGPLFISYPDGTRVTVDGSTTTMLTSDDVRLDRKAAAHSFERGGLRIAYRGDGSVQYDTPAASARYETTTRPENAQLWLFLFSLSIGLLVASKWYGVMAYGVAIVVVLGVWSQRFWPIDRIAPFAKRPAFWGNPFGFRLDVVASTIVFVTMTIYWAAYIPSFIGLSDTPSQPPRSYTISDIVTMQYNAYEYHAHMKATHPYSSMWYQWPIDIKPLLYYAKYAGSGATSTAGMIYSLPNPFIMWMGLLSVPWIGVLAFRERNKGYALLVITYLAQWLPWAFSPRIAFLYHFYVNIPIICLCNALLAQRLLKWASTSDGATQTFAKISVTAYFVLVALAFAYFYPILSGTPIPTGAWMQRMWFGHFWI